MSQDNRGSSTSQRPAVGPSIGRGRRGPGGMPGMGPVEKAKDFKTTLRHLLRYLKPFTPAIILSLSFAIVGTALNVLPPWLMGEAADVIFVGATGRAAGGGGVDFGQIRTIIIALAAIYVGSFVFSLLQGIMMASISQKVSYNLRKAFYAKINKMPLKYFDTNPHGDVLSRMTNDIDLMGDSLGQSLAQMITAAISLIGVITMMIILSVPMTAVALLVLPLSFVIVRFIVKRTQRYFKAQQKFLGAVNGQIEEVFAGHQVVKAFNSERRSLVAFNQDNDKLYTAAWKAQFVSALIFPLMFFVGNVGYIAVSILGAYMAIIGALAVGSILSFVQYARRISDPINMLAQVSNVLQSTVAAAERVFEFIDEKEESPEAENPADTGKVTGGVTFENVNFGYKDDTPIIHNFSADIAQGKRIAIVGPTGAGKTTIVKLLMRYYDLQDGRILIDGTDITEFKRDDLRAMMTMVLQDTWLFNGSIMENIRYGRLGATDDEVIAAAKAASAHHFIQTLPNGYEMEINEEANNISQGQKQLLTIARAILLDPKILILDEATSSVDTRTEILIQKAMDKLMEGRTSFIIAHRLSTIRHADLILVMNNGDIIEQGSHEELLAKEGFYSELYHAQFES
ncbi:MAG: ABC transporter ATP-binding protein/permease [Defluviitaleaceae bacterium]|nr:ABC transporter ATP-binding protein/permease [Defluviitaleaceae bacterium]